MTRLFDFVKEVGWMAAAAAVLIVSGCAVVLITSLEQGSGRTWTGSLSVSLALLVLGFAFFIATLVRAEARLTEARARVAADPTTLPLYDELMRSRDQIAHLRRLFWREEDVLAIEHKDGVGDMFDAACYLRGKFDEIAIDSSYALAYRGLAQRMSAKCSDFISLGLYFEQRYGTTSSVRG
jgi:hypothetical protein